MLIIGCDFHTRYQQIAMLDATTGEIVERRLDHLNGEAQTFYGSLRGPVRVGIEATGRFGGFNSCSPNGDTSYGWATPPRFARGRFAGKRPTRGMPGTFWNCCAPIASRASGFPRRSSGTCGNCCGIASSW